MGKKTRKTRWRTLSIADDHSDSEESSTTTAARLPKSFQQKSYYNKFTYSSQSTPRRRYQNDGIKSTRSSSTASENKITFNEDEYTRITTPRQDVLFKKGYLNKPRNYQTQTSTGTSTTSTGNSTGNGTPDYQSTDLEYESQFVFPNGFVDQNGIYYLNGYESYPLMFYNVPTYYPEYSTNKSKRRSSGSVAESTSPNNEEVTSQEHSGGEASNNLSDYSGHHNVYSVVYPGYYVNGLCPSHDLTDGDGHSDQPRRIKKRKRIKTSSSQVNQDSTEASDDETNDQHREENTKISSESSEVKENCNLLNNENEDNIDIVVESNMVQPSVENIAIETDNKTDETEDNIEVTEINNQDCNSSTEQIADNKKESNQNSTEATSESKPEETTDCLKPQKYDLKPDAEEFVPRAYRTPEVPLSPVQFIKVPPNFVPVPIVPFNGQNFNPAFIPPGIPLNFIPPNPKMFVEFVPNAPPVVKNVEVEKKESQIAEQPVIKKDCDISNTAKNVNSTNNEEKTEKKVTSNKTFDIATIVSKLEEAAKEQEENEIRITKSNQNEIESPKKTFKASQKYKNNITYKRSYYNSLHNSPQKENRLQKVDGLCNGSPQRVFIRNGDSLSSSPKGSPQGSPFKQNLPPTEPAKMPEFINYSHTNNPQYQKDKRFSRTSPDKLKNWKQPYQNGFNKWQQKGKYNVFSHNKQQIPNKMNEEVKDNRAQIPISKNQLDELQERLNTENILMQFNGEKNLSVAENRPHLKPNDVILNAKPSTAVARHSNQWISVCNKKKKKNKGMEDGDVQMEEQDVDLQNDQFEPYDINLLVDVIPLPHEETEDNVKHIETNSLSDEITINNDSKMNETKVQEIINSIAQMECNISESAGSLPVMKSVDDIEKELIEPIESGEKLETTENEILPESIQTSEETVIENNTEQTGAISKTIKKKPKKGSQKLPIKRVIITDVDLSEKVEEIKTPVKKIVKKVEKVPQKTENLIIDTNKVEEVTDNNEIIEKESNVCNEEDKKKKNKKRKKSTKTSDDSSSGSSTTLNGCDDSFDFFDSVLVGELEEKTNDELSQELDKIIQKGMYNSLEEKIKSLNIDESDGFFKSMFTKIPYRETNVGYSKIPDLTEILQNTTVGKPNSVSDEVNFQSNNKILNELELPTEDGFVLENPGFVEILKETESINFKDSITAEEIKIEQVEEPKTLYPITEAVKEWMSRTRETTPDVEILKSPSTIYKEFCDSASDSDTETEVGDSKNFINIDDDDEITIFTTEREGSLEQQDLMDYWDDEIKEHNNKLEKTQNRDISEEKEVIEIYESKYGKNEDFINLQKEIQEKNCKSNPKNSGLSQRAVCCNIM